MFCPSYLILHKPVAKNTHKNTPAQKTEAGSMSPSIFLRVPNQGISGIGVGTLRIKDNGDNDLKCEVAARNM